MLSVFVCNGGRKEPSLAGFLSAFVCNCSQYSCVSTPGSIPACAGEPRSAPVFTEWQRVYPRVCGGTQPDGSVTKRAVGLSPRVRGNLVVACRCRSWLRSIPACAGEPSACPRRSTPMRVYPRVCGGTSRPASDDGNAAGLSPRVRGNRGLLRPCITVLRSIPACAGEPLGQD